MTGSAGNGVGDVPMSRSALVRLGLLASIWGCSFMFIKVALEGLSPPQVVLGRMAFGTAALLAVVAARRLRLPRDPRLWVHLATFSVIANLVPFLLFAWGEQHISSSRAGVLNATTPLCTLIAALVFLPEERPTVNRVAGLVVGFAGVVVVIGPWADTGSGTISGQLACLGAAALYGLGFAYTSKFVSWRGVAPGVLATAQLLAGTVLLLAATPIIGWETPDLSARVVLSVATLGALGTGIAYLIYHALVRDAGATSTSLVTYLAPVIAVALGVLVLGERVTWNLFAGAAIVIAGVALAEGRLPMPGRYAARRRATTLRRT
jgi:drug/metabolite transporter (DMT)-like permease